MKLKIKTPHRVTPFQDGYIYFSIIFAKKYGIKEAVVLNHILYWIKKNIVNKNRRNFKDGKYWTQLSVKSLSDTFPFWTERQIRTIINKLLTKKAIEKRPCNNIQYYRANYYTVTENVFNTYEKLVSKIHSKLESK